MCIVLYIDGSPLLLENIKRNKSHNKIISAYVVNGAWELKLSTSTLYAFEDMSMYGWGGDKLRLRNKHNYESYEEIHVDIKGSYNDIIAAADKLRSIEKEIK